MCKILDMNTVTATYQKELEELHSLGFYNKNKNAKLLYCTKGDVEIVKNFLKAKDALQMKQKQVKAELKVSKKPRKVEKKDKLLVKEEKKELKRKAKEMRKAKKSCGVDPSENSNSVTEHAIQSPPQTPPFVAPERFHSLNSNSWPTGVAHLYLDGNNMLFVVAPIRSLVLKRKGKVAEAALEALARKFASALNLEHCTLIFDDTRRTSSQDKSFTVCSARPAYRTSDDALVQIAQQTEVPSLYVTSDRELLQRLEATGNHVVLCKPKEWFLFVAKTLNGSDIGVEHLDEWVAQWMKTNVEEEMDLAPELQTKLNL